MISPIFVTQIHEKVDLDEETYIHFHVEEGKHVNLEYLYLESSQIHLIQVTGPNNAWTPWFWVSSPLFMYCNNSFHIFQTKWTSFNMSTKSQNYTPMVHNPWNKWPGFEIRKQLYCNIGLRKDAGKLLTDLKTRSFISWVANHQGVVLGSLVDI